MSWRQQSDDLRRAMKLQVVPSLRARGFKGSFPHFFRPRGDRIDLLMFQFSQWGPDLYIEVASCPSGGDASLVPSKLRVFHISRHRARIGPMPSLDFSGIGDLGRADGILSAINSAISEEGEKWWQNPTSLAPT